MKNLLFSLLDLLYKKRCYICKSSKYSQKICPKCYDELEFSSINAMRIINSVNIYSCSIYEKNMQKIIRGLKYHNQKELAFYVAKFMYEYFCKLGVNKDFQVIPTPLHKNRLKQRKYNHMDLVVEEFCKLSGFVPNYELITRIKDTKPQYKLTRQERLKNLFNAFALDKSKLLDKPILILDDICTTGATFEEMINLLKDNNINDITCMATSSPVC